uniref:Uncharacterized protein n=1 Tax=Percolomonas cosmopolitus TaxID=63605 RepID=A0A7S1PFZ2_9EUKA
MQPDLHSQILSHQSLHATITKNLIASRLSHNHIRPLSEINVENEKYLVHYLRDLLRTLVDLRQDEQRQLLKTRHRPQNNETLHNIRTMRYNLIAKYLNKLDAYATLVYDDKFARRTMRKAQRMAKRAREESNLTTTKTKPHRILGATRRTPIDALLRRRRTEIPQHRMTLF